MCNCSSLFCRLFIFFSYILSFIPDSRTSCNTLLSFLPWCDKLLLQLPLSFHSLTITGAVEEIVWFGWNSTHMYSNVVNTVVGKSTRCRIYWAYFATMAQCAGHGEIHNCPLLQRHHALEQHFHRLGQPVKLRRKKLEVPNHLTDLEEYWSDQHRQLNGANLL